MVSFSGLQVEGDIVVLPRSTNQVRGLALYAISCFEGGIPFDQDVHQSVWRRIERFHTDSVLCGASALALGTNAPTILRAEALDYPKPIGGATVFGSRLLVHPEKAVAANCSAVREWDSNGTVFGYNAERGHRAGEFGHNDYYPVAIAAAMFRGLDGRAALRGMLLIDEIRSALAEVFSLKDCFVDHVLHGAIASAVVYGAMMSATVDQIESAVGMVCAHYVPFRAIRAGHQLSDSKGASAAISTEVAVLSVHRAMRGFIGPKDVFRNPQAIFRLFEGPGQKFVRVGSRTDLNLHAVNESPFDLVLAYRGCNWGVMGMHFKLGLYEHQSAGALEATIRLLQRFPILLDDRSGQALANILIRAYEPAFGIIGDPAKRDPHTRQSADHSMVYIVATLLRKALEAGKASWVDLMLMPADYDESALHHPLTRQLMECIQFEHGGPDYDAKYPDGIPTSVVVTDATGHTHDSGLVMYPGGHARNHLGNHPVPLDEILDIKFTRLADLASDRPADMVANLARIARLGAVELREIYSFPIRAVAS